MQPSRITKAPSWSAETVSPACGHCHNHELQALQQEVGQSCSPCSQPCSVWGHARTMLPISCMGEVTGLLSISAMTSARTIAGAGKQARAGQGLTSIVAMLPATRQTNTSPARCHARPVLQIDCKTPDYWHAAAYASTWHACHENGCQACTHGPCRTQGQVEHCLHRGTGVRACQN